MSQPLTVAREFVMSLQCVVGNFAIRACGLESCVGVPHVENVMFEF